MKFLGRSIIAHILVVLSLLSIFTALLDKTDIIVTNSYAQTEKKTLKIKGLYLGMDVGEAKKILEPYIEESKKVKEEVFFQDIIRSDQNGKVESISLPSQILYKMFNIGPMTGKDFIKQFADSYGIPKFEYKGLADRKFKNDRGSEIWYYMAQGEYIIKIIVSSPYARSGPDIQYVDIQKIQGKPKFD